MTGNGTTKHWTRRAFLAFSGTAALALTAAISPAYALTEEELVTAAKAEGEVTLYTAATENVAARIAEEFKKKYGVEVRFLRLGSSPLLQRYATEAESGNIVADLIITGGRAVAFATDGIEKGWIEPIGQAGLPVIDGGEFPDQFNRDVAALAQVQLWIIALNTDVVSAEEGPKDWPDLLDPKYKEQIIISSPAVSDAYVEFWAHIADKYGADYLTKLNEQLPRRFDAGVPALQALSAGEGAVQVPMTPPAVAALQSKGAPVEIITPNFTTGVEMQLILTSTDKSKSPNAGKLLANYLLSPEGNKILNADPGAVSPYDTSAFPSEYVDPNPEAISRRDEISKALGF